MTGDVNANTYTQASWDPVDYCVFAYAGVDTVKLGSGDDLLYAGDGADIVLGGPGDDNLRGEAGNDDMRAGPGADLLNGGIDSDTLYGNAGNDQINGGTGADTIRPGPGLDTAYGEDGNDIFVIGSPCEVTSGDVINGGLGTDKVRSPLSQTQLTALGVSFTSIETFEVVAYDHSECLVVGATLGAAGPLKPAAGIYTSGAMRNDGSVLAGTDHSHVVSISASGTATDLRSGDHVVISPTGHSFGVLTGSTSQFKVYDAANALQATLTDVDPSVYRMFPGSNYVFVPTGERHHESAHFTGANIYTLAGAAHGDFTADTMHIVSLTPTHVLHTTATELIKTEIDGDEVWRVTRSLREFAVSQTTPARFIALANQTSGEVMHFQENGTPSVTSIDGVPWDVTISPSGVYSAITVSKGASAAPRLYMYQNAVLSYAVELPLVYANSAAATDDGEIVIGGQTSSEQARVLVYNYNGNLLWQTDLSAERSGYRPKVLPSPDSDRFAVIATAGLNAFQINRSPT